MTIEPFFFGDLTSARGQTQNNITVSERDRQTERARQARNGVLEWISAASYSVTHRFPPEYTSVHAALIKIHSTSRLLTLAESRDLRLPVSLSLSLTALRSHLYCDNRTNMQLIQRVKHVDLGILPYKILRTQKYIPFHHQRSTCF